jgi:hypothetical protein
LSEDKLTEDYKTTVVIPKLFFSGLDAERRDAYRRDADSGLHFCEHEPSEATRHDAGKPTPSVVTPRRHTDSEHQSKPRKASGSDMARCWQTDEQRRDANRPDADITHHI